ncbi:serine hydrolase domain-containing protein [Paenibacillus radicis (ex Xue et al. 2023)]|uniref:Beta-lactamase family protein n=1 Tax=Paenibacillus radicis (ex Xue et al. 2023) TaxID=2972489 RepID=A0ABT1YT15_9BACL|nr:serine hydrolase [Paenibacillus radicis (ex Xue et al. 2023)]MCR8635489.1 beta-lactamase family protein [Paenibacillus radicis (ex Xue et al. 2023)]
MRAEIRRDLPENHGLSSKHLLRFFTRVEELNLQLNSFILLQDGQSTAQFWRKPYRKDAQQLLFSLSKSFTSIAAGIACDHGYLDLQDKVISFFPDKLPAQLSVNLTQMTVHHLLSMNTGHHENIYSYVVNEQDWVKAFLSLEVQHKPGSYYRYSTPATYMLSAIIEKVTGESLVDFLMPRLFEPLGIPRPSWETCPMGITAGGMGLSLTTESIAKFGQMLLDKGMYEGQRIVSESYIDLATREQSDNRRGETRMDTSQGYGYQFILCRRGCFRGDGAFGQLCFVAPNERIVIAATSSFASMKPLQTLLDLIFEHIMDPLDPDSRPSLDDNDELQQHLANMSYPVPLLKPISDVVPNRSHQCYIMDKNSRHLQELNLFKTEEKLEVQLIYEDRNNKVLSFDFTKPVTIEDIFTKDLSLHQQEAVAYAEWPDNNTLKLTLFYIETPYVVTYTIKFNNPNIELQFRINVSHNIEDYTINGKLKSYD